jgi:hypothetical protein
MKTIDNESDFTTTGSYSSRIYPATDTSGSQFETHVTPSIPSISLTRSAHEIVEQIESHVIKDDAIRLLEIFEKVAISLKTNAVDISRLPNLNATSIDDDTLFIEWIFSDFRIGFTLGSDPTNNSWFLVTNRKLEEYSSSSSLTRSNMESIIFRLVNFALANS